ncbi:type II toxin-antitoxin system HipA family toxin [bacterium]|nr:type II toxin-antitoxin system HipA family toxin [bacterium]
MNLKVFYNAYGERRLMGLLSQREGRIFFEYAPDFLNFGLEVSPFKLPLRPGLFEGDPMFAGGLFGLFNDSLPDGWGCLLLDRQLMRRNISYNEIGPIDRLRLIGKDPFGALEYEPAEEGAEETIKIILDSLAREADKILEGRSQEMLDELVALNGSSGGARPKITALVSDDKSKIVQNSRAVPDGLSSWIIKFSNKRDRKDLGLHEYVYSLIAKKAGIKMSETYLFPSKNSSGHFGTKRFDREGNQKIHIHSASGLLHADFRIPCLDYASLLRLTQLLTKNQQDIEQMVRLMIFNVKAGNKDDHSKNFTFLLDKAGEWHLSPAYDLTRSSGINGEQTAMVNGKGCGITDEDLIKEAQRYNVSAGKIREMIAQTEDALADYDKLMKELR